MPVTHFMPYRDGEYMPPQDVPVVAKYRRFTTHLGVPASAPVIYRVRMGFTLKEHAPQLGPCMGGLRNLNDEDFVDEPTKDSVVFWAPCLLPGSQWKSPAQQMRLLSELRQEF